VGKRVDGYLSNKAQEVWPDSLVFDTQGREGWIIEREDGETIELGSNFREAKSALFAMMSAVRNRNKRSQD